MDQLNQYLNIFFTLLAIVDPLGAIPIFLSLAPSQSNRLRKKIAWITTLTVGLALIISVLLGEHLLALMGISIDSFRVAGGILLLILGIPMLRGDGRYALAKSKKLCESNEENDYAVVPLAIPLLAGPGAISSMIIYAHQYQSLYGILSLVAISIMVAVLSGITLLLARPIGLFLKRTGILITIRLMGLILSAAAVQFMVNGLLRLFPGLAH